MFKQKVLMQALLPLLVASRCLAGRNTEKWWQKPFSMFQTNIREIDANMDVNKTAKYIREYGATAWLLNVGGILANYPTKLDFQIECQTSSERPSGDLVHDAMDAARDKELRLLGRMDFSKIQASVAQDHEDWLYISPNGTWQNHTNGLVSVCPSGPWYQERVFDILEEVMSLYELDGFFVNWAGYNERDYFRVYHGVCHCKNCRERWKSYSSGKTLPDGPWSETYDEWKIFSDGVIDDWTGRVRDFIADRLPEAGLILGESSDIMFHEANNAVGREMWHHATSETASQHKSHRPDVPVLVNAASFLDIQYRFAAENTAQYMQYHLQAIARGANPSTYIIGTPWNVPWPSLNQTSELMRFYQRWKDVYTGMKPVSKTGLVLPSSSHILNDTLYEEAVSEYKGLHMALQEIHVPFDIINQKRITNMTDNDSLLRYDLIVLPNLGTLSSEHADALDDWVSKGGTLIATGSVGVETDNSTLQLASLPATSLVELNDEEEQLWSTYMAPEQDNTEEHFYQGPIIPIVGSFGVYDWKEDSTGLYKQLGYAPFAPPEYIYGNIQTEERGVGMGSFDNGTGVLIPFTVGRGYHEVGLDVFRDFFAEVIDQVGAVEELSFDFAPQVEVILNRNDNDQIVIHLINISGKRQQNWMQHFPLPAGSIKVSGQSSDVKAISLTSNTTLKIEDNGVIELPGLDLYEVVVIEGLA